MTQNTQDQRLATADETTPADEERIAIGRLMRDYQSAGLAVDSSVAATLRKMLMRLGGER